MARGSVTPRGGASGAGASGGREARGGAGASGAGGTAGAGFEHGGSGTTRGVGGTNGDGAAAGDAGNGQGGEPPSGGRGGAGGANHAGRTGEAGGGAAGETGAGFAGSGAGAGPEETCVVFVDGSGGSDEHDGTSWAEAYATLGPALGRATSGCELWLTLGTYVPGTERSATFLVPNGVTLRGGFNGTEAHPDERTHAGRSVLSGDIGTDFDASNDAYHVVVTAGDATLDQLEVSSGNADGTADQDRDGAGIYARGALTLVDVAVSNHRAVRDGAGVLALGPLTIWNSSFERNAAGARGGSIAALGAVNVVIDNTTFRYDSAALGAGLFASGPMLTLNDGLFEWETSETGGSGIATDPTTTMTLTSTIVQNNSTTGDGAAIVNLGTMSIFYSRIARNTGSSHAAIASSANLEIGGSELAENEGALSAQRVDRVCPANVWDTRFLSNTSQDGGAGAIWARDCPVTVDGSQFSDNSGQLGGAIYFQVVSAESELVVTNSEFARNSAALVAGGAAVAGGSVRFTRVKFDGNTGNAAGALDVGEGATLTVERSLFQSNVGATRGGAVAAWNGDATISDSAFVKNRAPLGGAVYQGGAAALTLTNVSLFANVANDAGVSATGELAVRNSVFWSDQPKDLASSGSLAIVSSNFTNDDPSTPFDPHFYDSDRDLRLAANSPCIDVADDDYASDADLNGLPRVDVAGVPTCQTLPCGSVADLGAYEYRP